MRKLASIRRINELLPIEGADLIVTAVIDGWTVVVKKDEFQVGDHCVYFEIDSFLPDGNPLWQHLVDKSSRTFEGVKGHRLKTITLRKQLSQGFVIPVPRELEIDWSHTFLNFEGARPLREGDDVTDILNIKKWEAVIPTELAGQVNGNFPSFIKKTDQERCQNIGTEIFVDNCSSKYEITMKMDGTSFTGFHVDGEEGVCSRNWELKIDAANEGNSLVRMYVDSGLQLALRGLGLNYAVQGELMGPGIQGNREGLKAHRLFVFDIYDIDGGCYLTPDARHRVMDELWAVGMSRQMVEHAPVIKRNVTLSSLGITTVAQLLAFAEGPSYLHPIREGFVFKREDGGFSFKAISNKFLLKEKD